ncbi:MAG: HNH endonuclease [Thermoleophilia bacterium]
MCEQAIDYEANGRRPTAFEADHAQPVSTHPHLALVMSNLRPSHQSCNRGRGARLLTGTWVKADW